MLDGLDRYPGARLSSDERRRVDAFALDAGELTTDHILYSLGRYVEGSFANLMLVVSELAGLDVAMAIAREAGRRHGGTGYASLLRSRGTPGRGSPALMAAYQDLAHAVRGPKHALAIPALHDERTCTVRKAACGFYDETRPDTATFVGAFEAGCFDGYLAADGELESIDVARCCWQGAAGCEIGFTWRNSGNLRATDR